MDASTALCCVSASGVKFSESQQKQIDTYFKIITLHKVEKYAILFVKLKKLIKFNRYGGPSKIRKYFIKY